MMSDIKGLTLATLREDVTMLSNTWADDAMYWLAMINDDRAGLDKTQFVVGYMNACAIAFAALVGRAEEIGDIQANKR